MRMAVFCLILLFISTGCQVATKTRDPSSTGWVQARTDTTLKTARRRMESGNPAGARRELEILLLQGVEDARVYLLFAQVAIEEGSLAEAYRHLDRADRLLGINQTEKGNGWEAAAPAQLEAVEVPLDDMNGLNGRNDGVLILGFNTRMAIFGTGTGSDRGEPEVAAAFLIRGLLEEMNGRWKEATEAYASAAGAMPGEVGPILSQVRTLHAAGMGDRVVELLETVLQEQPLAFDLLLAAGKEQTAAGRHEEALVFFRRALEVRPQHASARRLLALALHLSGRHEAAITALEDCLSRECPDSGGKLRLALARSALVIGRYALAASTFREYLGSRSGDGDSMFDLARALFLSDQPEESRKILHKALALDPCLHRCVALLGHIHYQMGQWDEAVEKYRKAILLGADAETLDPLIESARMKGGPQ